MRVWKAAHGIDRTWATTERLLVGLSPSPASSRLVRAARRMAGSLHATWIAVYVETPASLRLSKKEREQLAENLRFAQQLGAETGRINLRRMGTISSVVRSTEIVVPQTSVFVDSGDFRGTPHLGNVHSDILSRTGFHTTKGLFYITLPVRRLSECVAKMVGANMPSQ